MSTISYLRGSDKFVDSNLFDRQHVGPYLLDPSSERSLREMSGLSPRAEIWIPKDTPVGCDWTCKDWVSMFEVVVRSGVTFPFCPLMIELIQFLKVLPCQVMPLI